MDESTLTRLFEPFSQALRSFDRSRGGLGLGLTLVKAFIEMHGGAVSASSKGPERVQSSSFGCRSREILPRRAIPTLNRALLNRRIRSHAVSSLSTTIRLELEPCNCSFKMLAIWSR